MSLHFYKRPTLVPIFANWNKSKEDFSLLQKKKKNHYHANVFPKNSIAQTSECGTYLSLGISLTKYVQTLCVEKYETLVKEMEEDQINVEYT